MECVICLDTLDQAYTLGCDHKFHEACIKQWLTINSICPICRTESVEIGCICESQYIESTRNFELEEQVLGIILTPIYQVENVSIPQKLRLIISIGCMFICATYVSLYTIAWVSLLAATILTVRYHGVLTILLITNVYIFLTSTKLEECCSLFSLSFGVNVVVLFLHLICNIS